MRILLLRYQEETVICFSDAEFVTHTNQESHIIAGLQSVSVSIA